MAISSGFLGEWSPSSKLPPAGFPARRRRIEPCDLSHACATWQSSSVSRCITRSGSGWARPVVSVEHLPQRSEPSRRSDADWLADHCPCEICRTSAPDHQGPRGAHRGLPLPMKSHRPYRTGLGPNWQRRPAQLLSATTPDLACPLQPRGPGTTSTSGNWRLPVGLAPHEVGDAPLPADPA